MTGFEVQAQACPTCVYRKDSALDPRILEESVADRYGGFSGYRICHQSSTACCRGFWNRHKDKFAMGQIAQRLGFVRFVQSHDRKGSRVSKSVASSMRRLKNNSGD